MKRRRFINFAVVIAVVACVVYVAARALLPPGYLVPLDVVAHRNIPYGNQPAQRLDIYEPRNARGALPLVVWIHGGGWEIGSKSNCPAANFADPTTDVPREEGMIVASIDYRFLKTAIWPAQIYDAKGAIRWLRAHAAQYHIDPNRIGVWGASAGGQMAALLGTSAGVKSLEGTVGGNLNESSAVQAVCDWYGPVDFVNMPKQIPANMLEYYDKQSQVARLLGGPVSQHMALAKAASAVTYINKTDPPFFIEHGDADDVVPLAQSQDIYERLQKAGVDSRFVALHGLGHAFMGNDNIEAVRQFFSSKLNSGG